MVLVQDQHYTGLCLYEDKTLLLSMVLVQDQHYTGLCLCEDQTLLLSTVLAIGPTLHGTLSL